MNAPALFLSGKVALHAGDCLDILRAMPSNSVDSVCTDPPYHLTSIVKRFGAADAAPAKEGKTGAYARASRGFMGKQWDGGDIAFRPELWAEVLRVLKPGGYVVAFGGTRTYHRLACAIEDAGFDVRDMVSWIFGSGFPKSHDVAKGITARETLGSARTTDIRKASMGENYAPSGRGRVNYDHGGGSAMNGGSGKPVLTEAARQWEGWGTALKPALEPICLARKPLSEGTVAANVLRWGTGALNIDGCRVEGVGNKTFKRDAGSREREQYRTGTTVGAAVSTDLGRWPANICHDGSDEVVEAFPQTSEGRFPERQTRHDASSFSVAKGEVAPTRQMGDAGSAARFFASFPKEQECTILNASDAVSNIELSSARAASALSNAAEASMPGSVLQGPSYQAPSTTVTASELKTISELVTETILLFEQRCLLASPPAKLSLSNSLAECAVVPRQIGITTIILSLSKSNGSVALVTFNIMRPSLDLGEKVSGKRLHYSAKADADDRVGSRHPTVKPVDLMRWLVRLVTPPGGTVLDPFAGTGTTGEAAWREGFKAVLIEREVEYQADIARRMALCLAGPDERARASIKARHGDLPAGPLFDMLVAEAAE